MTKTDRQSPFAHRVIDGLVVRETRAATCDETWTTEANAAIAAAVASGAVILADYRRDPEP
jgi:hypothetical protein